MQFLYDDIILGENRNIITKDTEALLEASVEDGLEVNTQKTKKYMIVSRHKM
jgi:hypothetical protein